MVKPSATELAYMAGFLDGEGYVAISKSKKITKWRSVGLTLTVAISQINPEPLLFIHQFFGGHLREEPAKKNRRKSYTWLISSKAAYNFLLAVLPYLKVKKDEVKVGLKFQETMGRPLMKVPENILDERQKLYTEMKSFKSREF